MTENLKLTDLYLRNLKPEGKEYTRREKGGFGVRVHPSGKITFFYLYRVDGQRRFLNLGAYKTKNNPNGVSLKEARDEYEIQRAKVKALKQGRADGSDPVEEMKAAKSGREAHRDEKSIKDLVQEYIEKHAQKFKRSWQEDERLLNREVIPVWGKRKAADITKRDVTLLLEGIVDRGSPAMSNQVLKIVRKMFNFAIERDILQNTPFLGVKALAPNIKRERTLAEAEIKTLWVALDSQEVAISDEIRRALKLILVTAQRPGEVSGMHTDEIEDRWWTIPAERAKNGKAHRVYLTDLALELIGAAIEQAKENREIPTDQEYSGYVFPCPHKKKNQPIDSHALPVAVRRNLAWPITDAKGKPLYDKDGEPATENKLGVSQFTPHDLRRTAATFMAEMGYMDEVIDAVLNHSKQGVIKVYNLHKYDREKQMALEAWSRKLEALVKGEEGGKVIPITRGKAE